MLAMSVSVVLVSIAVFTQLLFSEYHECVMVYCYEHGGCKAIYRELCRISQIFRNFSQISLIVLVRYPCFRGKVKTCISRRMSSYTKFSFFQKLHCCNLTLHQTGCRLCNEFALWQLWRLAVSMTFFLTLFAISSIDLALARY